MFLLAFIYHLFTASAPIPSSIQFFAGVLVGFLTLFQLPQACDAGIAMLHFGSNLFKLIIWVIPEFVRFLYTVAGITPNGEELLRFQSAENAELHEQIRYLKIASAESVTDFNRKLEHMASELAFSRQDERRLSVEVKMLKSKLARPKDADLIDAHIARDNAITAQRRLEAEVATLRAKDQARQSVLTRTQSSHKETLADLKESEKLVAQLRSDKEREVEVLNKEIFHKNSALYAFQRTIEVLGELERAREVEPLAFSAAVHFMEVLRVKNVPLIPFGINPVDFMAGRSTVPGLSLSAPTNFSTEAVPPPSSLPAITNCSKEVVPPPSLSSALIPPPVETVTHPPAAGQDAEQAAAKTPSRHQFDWVAAAGSAKASSRRPATKTSARRQFDRAAAATSAANTSDSAPLSAMAPPSKKKRSSG